jgi:hypothetical protein
MKRQAVLIAVIGFILAGFMFGQVAGQEKPAPQTSSQALAALLEEMLDMGHFGQGEGMTLKHCLIQVMKATGDKLSIVVDTQAFEEENPDAERVLETIVKFPSYPRKQKVAMVLRQALGHVRTNNATYLLRGGVIEITTLDRAKPESLLGYPIMARINNRPLDKAINQLSDLSGATIIIDSRVGEKAKTHVSASFKNSITLERATSLLAEMADLQVEVRDDILFITAKVKAEDEQQKKELHFQGRRLDLALRDLATWSGANILLDPRYIPAPVPIHKRGPDKRAEIAAAQAKPVEKVALRNQEEMKAPKAGGLDPRAMKVTASFRPTVSAEIATRILANQVGLSVAVLGDVLYVTNPANADRLLREKSGKFSTNGD